jgi:cystathionine beta-lyase
VDNTFASPVSQKPINLGADIVVHSATKYLGGHSDLISGLVVTATPELGEKIKFIQNATGGILAPFDSWLVIRGIETLDLRVERHSRNAQAIAEYLETEDLIGNIYYPGLASHPNHAVAKKQQKYFGGIISFDLKIDNKELATKIVTSTKYFKLAESLGGVKSLCCLPCEMTHKSIPQEKRYAAGVTDSLIRISVGLEDADDLIADLKQAFATAKKSIQVSVSASV